MALPFCSADHKLSSLKDQVLKRRKLLHTKISMYDMYICMYVRVRVQYNTIQYTSTK